MRGDLLQWDQALTLADRYGIIFPRTSICSPPSQWRPCTMHMRRDLLQWDQALTLPDRYGTIYPRTSIYSPHSQWKPCTCADIYSSGTRHSCSLIDMVQYTQRWAKGPFDRFSDTDSIFRLYRTIQSVDVKFRFDLPIVSDYTIG